MRISSLGFSLGYWNATMAFTVQRSEAPLRPRLGARREMRQPAEIRVVLDAQSALVRERARELDGRGEGKHAFSLAGELRVDDRVEGRKPVFAAVADDRPDLHRTARLLEALLHERELP